MAKKTKLWFEMPTEGVPKEFHFRACICGDYVDVREIGEVTMTDAQAKVALEEYPTWFHKSKPKAAEAKEEKAANPPEENKAANPPTDNK